jgi:hypothetical protein
MTGSRAKEKKMTTETGAHLAKIIRATQADLKQLCEGIDEATACRAPAGRWTPKEIISHLIGPGGDALLGVLGRFLSEDVPLIEIVPEQTHFTQERQSMTFAQLLALMAQKYEELARYAEGLSEEQFGRTAHIPLFKDSPLTEYPTLAAFLGGLGQYHVQMHIDHLRQILDEPPTA